MKGNNIFFYKKAHPQFYHTKAQVTLAAVAKSGLSALLPNQS